VTDTAEHLQAALRSVVDAIDEHRIQISDGARRRLVDAADTLGFLARQADWQALAPPLPLSGTTPEPTGAEADYRERVALADQALEDAHKEHHPPVVRAESMMEAQMQATLALAAATLMADEPRVELGTLDTYELREATGRSIARLPLPPAPRLSGEDIDEYVDRLRLSLEEAQLARIQEKHPDLDLDIVVEHRAAVRRGTASHITGGMDDSVPGDRWCRYGCERSFR
jgi:hypothetical protein